MDVFPGAKPTDTFCTINSVLPSCIAQLVESYITPVIVPVDEDGEPISQNEARRHYTFIGAGHYELIISHATAIIATDHDQSIEDMMRYACGFGYLELARNIASRLTDSQQELGHLALYLDIACRYARGNVIQAIIVEYGNNVGFVESFRSGAAAAIQFRQLDQLKMLMSAKVFDAKSALKVALKEHNLDAAHAILAHANHDWRLLSFGLNSACSRSDMDLVMFMIEHGASNWNYALSKTCWMASGRHPAPAIGFLPNAVNIARVLVAHGATKCSYHTQHQYWPCVLSAVHST